MYTDTPIATTRQPTRLVGKLKRKTFDKPSTKKGLFDTKSVPDSDDAFSDVESEPTVSPDVDTGPDVDLAQLQLSYVAGSLALAESEQVADNVIAVLNKTIPEFKSFLQTLNQDSAQAGARIMLPITNLLQQLTLSIRELAVGGLLTNWNEAALAVAAARQALEKTAGI